jgi:hypothetical protein
MKFRVLLASAAVAVAAIGGTAGPALASSSSQASPARPAVTQLASDAGRGNVDHIEVNSWGVRIWLDHQGTQAMYQSVAAAGSIPGAPIPYVPWYIQAPVILYVHCISQFVNDIKNDDQGYGIVMDLNYWAPWWTCGTLKVWGQ